jgi:hypothetical protein
MPNLAGSSRRSESKSWQPKTSSTQVHLHRAWHRRGRVFRCQDRFRSGHSSSHPIGLAAVLKQAALHANGWARDINFDQDQTRSRHPL